MLDNLRDLLTAAVGGGGVRMREGAASVGATKVQLDAGAGLLEKTREEWAAVGARAGRCASAAERTDRLITRLHSDITRHYTNAQDLCQSLSSLPKLCAAVDECIENLQSLETLLTTVEDELTDLEDLADRRDMAQRKIDHHYHMGRYKERKLAALEETRTHLARQSSQKHAERERRQLESLQGRHAACEEAFTQDVQQYLATGAVPPKIPIATTGLTLEQVQLEDTNNDQLDMFLNS